MGAGFAEAINQILRTRQGSLINLGKVMQTIWGRLFDCSHNTDLSATQAWIVLGVTCILCLRLLAKRIRGFEVIK